MSKSLNRFLSWALVIVMILGMLPTTAFAAEDESASNTENSVVDENINGDSSVETEDDPASGTEDDPILINDLEDLILFRDAVNTYTSNGSNQFKGKYVKLTADIDLQGINWTPIGTNSVGDHMAFLGTFDGDGHTISNLYINADGGHLGFFARVGSYGEGIAPTVKNITFNNVDVSANVTDHWTDGHGDYVGGVIANAGGNSIVSNVKVTGDVYIAGCGYVGGIVGHGYPDIDSCHVAANEGSYLNCGYWCAGGIIGYAGEGGTPITNCSVSGLDIWTAYGAGGAVAGLLQDGNKLEKVHASNVEITTNSDYCMGYIAGNGESSTMTDVTMDNVSVTANGKEATPSDAVATIGDTTYFSLQAAIDAVAEGETITLLRDVNVITPAYGENALNHARAVSFSLDLNGKTLSANTGNSVLRFNIAGADATSDVTVTVKNGKIVAGADTWCAVMASAPSAEAKAILNLENLTVESSKAGDLAVKAWSNSVINAKNVTVNATNGAGGFYALGGEIVLDNCTVIQKGLHTAPYLSMALAVSDGGKMTVNSGTYSTEPTAAAEGNNQGTSHGSWVGGVMNSGGTLIINGGTFSNGNFGEDNLATAARGLLFVDTAGKIEVNGGTFNALKNIFDVQNNLGDASKQPDALVSGGTFSADPREAGSNSSFVRIANGYVVKQNADGTYGLKAANEAWILRNGMPVFYATLADAIADAQAGETVMLCANATVDTRITIDKNITISDYGTLTVSLLGNAGFDIKNSAEVTFDNFNIDISGAVIPGDAIITVGKDSTAATLNLSGMNITGDGYSSAYAVIYLYTTGNLNIEGGSIDVSNDQSSAGGVIKANGSAVPQVNISNATLRFTDAGIGFLDGTVVLDKVELTINGGGNAINGSALTVKNSTVTIDGANGRGITLNQGDVTIENSTLKLSNCSEGEIRFKKALKLNVDETSVITACSIWSDVSAGAMVNDTEVTGTEANKSSITNATVTNPGWAAKVDGVYYMDLVAALKSAKADSVITLMRDITITEDWDCRNTKFTVPVTIDGNGKTIKFTGKISDGLNHLAAFRFEADATVKNLTVDMSEAIGVFQNRFSAISAKSDLTVENCTFIGSSTYTNARAIIFGEGSGADGIGEVDVVITGSSFTNWRYGIVDNMNAQDAKTVTITGNTFNNASVQVSAAESLAFTGNTVSDGAFVNITSYAEETKLQVNATGNTMSAHDQTKVSNAASYDNIQEEFIIGAVASVVSGETVTYFNDLTEAFAAAKNGDTVNVMKAGTYTLSTSGKDITITGVVDGVVFSNIGAKNMGGANVTFKNVTFNYAENSTYKGLQHAGNLVYNNCTINGQVFLYGTSETFNNCTFNTTDTDNYNIWTYGAKEVAFNECTFNCAGKSVLIYKEGDNTSFVADVTVTECQFVATNAVDGKAALEMDSSLIAGINLTVDGESAATGFGTGNVSGNSLWNNKKGCEGVNNDITVTVNGEVVLQPVKTAEVGGLYYTTLGAALDAAKAGDTVTLLENVTVTTSVIITKGITIDGNGHSIKADENAIWYTVGNFNMKNYKTHLLKVNSSDVTVKNIVLDCNDNAAGINIYGVQNIVFDNVEITNTNKGVAALTVNNSSLTVKTKLSTGQNSVAIDIDKGNACVIVDPGTVFELNDKTVKFSTEGNDLSNAVNADGTPYFVAVDNAYYYTKNQMDSRTTAYSNGLTLLTDVELSKNISVRGTFDLNGHTVTLADGYALTVSNAMTLAGDGTIVGSIKLTATNATLTASAGMNVTTDLAGYMVSYENGVYAVARHFASVTDSEGNVSYYATLDAALAAAQSGDTIQLTADCETGYVVLTPGKTLDLNGFQLTADGVAVFKDSHVIDSSVNTTGLLVVPEGYLSLQANNKEVPLWNEVGGYVFVTPKTSGNQAFATTTDNSFDLRFRPAFGYVNGESVKDTYFVENGGADNGLKMVIRLSWVNSQGYTVHHDVEFTDELFKGAYQSGQAFKVVVTGTGAFGEITVNAVIVSDTGVEFVGEDIVYNPDMANNA